MSVHVPWSADSVAGGQPTCVTQRELSGPDSGHQKRQDGIRGGQAHSGAHEKHAERAK